MNYWPEPLLSFFWGALIFWCVTLLVSPCWRIKFWMVLRCEFEVHAPDGDLALKFGCYLQKI